MTAKEAKRELKQLWTIRQLIERKQNGVAVMRSQLENITSSMKPDKVRSSSDGDTMGNAVIAVLEAEEDLRRQLVRLMRAERAVLSRIDQLENHLEQMVLIARYVEGLEWQQVAVELHYEERQVYRIHGRALVSYANVSECQS